MNSESNQAYKTMGPDGNVTFANNSTGFLNISQALDQTEASASFNQVDQNQRMASADDMSDNESRESSFDANKQQSKLHAANSQFHDGMSKVRQGGGASYTDSQQTPAKSLIHPSNLSTASNHLSQQFQQSLNMDPRQNLASQFLPSSIHQRSSGHTPNVIRNDSSSGEDVSHREQMRREASRG